MNSVSNYGLKDAFELYVYYLAVKKHFTSDYDFFKYNGKIRASVESFEKRRDKFYFFKLSKRKDAQEFVLSNVIYDPSCWIGDLIDNPKAEENALEWKKRQESISYVMQLELNELPDNYTDLVKVENGQWPRLLSLYHQRKVGLELLIALDDMTNVFKYWNKHINDIVLWPNEYRILAKSKGFISYDKEKIAKMFKEKFATS